MVVHFTPRRWTLVKSGDRPAGLGGQVVLAEDAVERSLMAQCKCGGQSLKSKKQALAKFANKVQSDPVLMRKLGRRVYELMQADLDLQRERNWNYGARSGWNQS